jgi:hypothetical protein
MYLHLALALGVAQLALAHGDHGNNREQQPMVDEKADWMTRHMAGAPIDLATIASDDRFDNMLTTMVQQQKSTT